MYYNYVNHGYVNSTIITSWQMDRLSDLCVSYSTDLVDGTVRVICYKRCCVGVFQQNEMQQIILQKFQTVYAEKCAQLPFYPSTYNFSSNDTVFSKRYVYKSLHNCHFVHIRVKRRQ